MPPRKKEITKAALKKAGTMAATAADGQEFLKQAWGEDKLNRVNALLDARDQSDINADGTTSSASSTAAATGTTASSSTSTKSKAKPKLSKARTMKNTAKEGKALIGKQVIGGTRAETKSRQAAVKAKKTLQEVTNPTGKRKAGLKRLGTMANTAREGKAYVKRATGNKKKAKTTSGRKRTGGRAIKATK